MAPVDGPECGIRKCGPTTCRRSSALATVSWGYRGMGAIARRAAAALPEFRPWEPCADPATGHAAISQGRAYEMGRMRAIFKADRDETAGRYSTSEWWLEPRTRGPGVHAHNDDHIFYLVEGSLSLLVDGQWSI